MHLFTTNFKLYGEFILTKTGYSTFPEKKNPQNCIKKLRAYILLRTTGSCFRYDTLTVYKIKFKVLP